MSTGKMVALILGVCAGVGVLLIAVCGGLFYAGYRDLSSADAEISPRIDAMFLAIDNDTLASSYANETTTDFKRLVSEEQFVAMGKAIELRLGKLETKSKRAFHIKKRNAESYADVTYSAVFEKGKGTITSTLRKQDGEWKFVGFRVNSPVFEQDMATRRCPSCNQPHSPTAKFCPACGASLTAQSENEPVAP